LKIEENHQITLHQLVEAVEQKFNIETSISGIDRALSKLDITWKNVYPIPVDWNTDSIYQ